jgi:hypothetical protein
MSTELPTLSLTLAPNGIDCKVTIDGVNLSPYLTGIEVRAKVHEATRVTLEVLAGVHVEGQAGEILRGLVPSHARPIDDFDVSVLHVQPGDVVVLTTPGPVSRESAERITAYIDRELHPLGAKAWLMGDGLTVARVLRGGEGGPGAGAPALEGAGGRPDGAEDGAGGAR